LQKVSQQCSLGFSSFLCIGQLPATTLMTLKSLPDRAPPTNQKETSLKTIFAESKQQKVTFGFL